MVDIRFVYSDPKTGKSYKKEVTGADRKAFFGKKIGDTVKGELLGMTGYEFVITGGSDDSGFPMRSDVPGPIKARILAVKGVGVSNKAKYRKKKKKGLRTMEGRRIRVRVAGNTVHEKTSQVNLKIKTYGKEPLAKPAEAAPAEQPAA